MVNFGTYAKFVCDGVEIKWKVDGRNLAIKDKTEKGGQILWIPSASLDDAGRYQCNGKDEYGNPIEDFGDLVVKGEFL